MTKGTYDRGEKGLTGPRCGHTTTDAHGRCLPCRAAKMRAYRAANPDRHREANLRHSYGLSLAEYDALLEAQGGVCAICGRSQMTTSKRFAVDHDHETDAVRGLLCGPCNTAIGLFEDDPARLTAAIFYLSRTRAIG